MNIFYKIKQTFEAKSVYWAANYPKAWSLGWLTQICIAVILFLLTFLVALIIPVSAIDTPDVMTWYALGYIPAFFWTLFIIYRLVKYNSEKLYGDRSIWHSFIELPTYIVQLSLPLLIPIILGCTLVVRVGMVVDDQKLDDNSYAFEEAQPFFTFDYGSGNYMYHEYDYDYEYDYRKEDSYNYDYLHEMFKYFETDERYYQYIIADEVRKEEEAAVYEMLNGNYREGAADSLSNYRYQLKDSIAFHKGVFKDARPRLYPYRFYEFQNDYNYRYNYDYDYDYVGQAYVNQDSIKQQYFYKHFKDKQFVEGKYNELVLAMKSMGFENVAFTPTQLMSLYHNNVYYADNEGLGKQIMLFDRQISLFKKQINYIDECKNRHFFFIYDMDAYQILFGLVFGFSLILALFKNMSWVEFLVGLLCVFLIPALLGILMAVMNWQEEGITFTFWSVFFILVIWGVIEKRKGIRRKRGAMFLMVPHLLAAYFPLMVLGTMIGIFNFWDWPYFDRYLIHAPTVYDPNNMVYSPEYWYMKRHSFDWAIILGYSSYLLVLYPLWIKRDWLKFIAKPKKA